MTGPRTCALCGERDATTETVCDGRRVPACARCLAPVEPPRPVIGGRPDRAAEVERLIRYSPGITGAEINYAASAARRTS